MNPDDETRVPSTAKEAPEKYTWDLTEYYADDAAFGAAVAHLADVEIPAYRVAVDAISDADTLLAAPTTMHRREPTSMPPTRMRPSRSARSPTFR